MKSFKQITEDIQPGYAPEEISFGGYTTKNLHHSADAAKAFQSTIEKVNRGEIKDKEGVLHALKATDTYMKLNDMHLEQGKAPDEVELQQWKTAHDEARMHLHKIGEFMHHMDYWHMHEHEIQDMETKYNPETAGAEMADSYEPQGDRLDEELTTKTIRPTDKIKVARVIADMLGVEKAESMTPEAAINMGLRKVKNKRMTPELVGVLTKMLKLAQEVGVKVDMSMIPAAMKEEAKDLQEMDKVAPVSDYTMASDILRLKDYIALQQYPKAENAKTKVGHGHHPVKAAGEDEEDQIRRMKVKYKTEEADIEEQSISYDTSGQQKRAAKAKDKAQMILRHTKEKEALASRHHAQKQAMAREEVDLKEAAGQHKVTVTVSEPDHTMVSKRKDTVMKRVIVNADNKDHAVVKAKEYYKKKGYKVHDAEYHSAQPKSSMATEEVELEEAKATYCGRCGTTHVPPSQGGTCPALKKEDADVPFEGGKKKQDDVKDKSGAVHTTMSRVRHLARMAAKQQQQKQPKKEVDLKEDEIETADFKTDKAGRKYRAHKIHVEEVESNNFEILDLSDDEIENMVNTVSFDDMIDELDDDDIAIVDADTGEEIEDDENVNEEALHEVLSRSERMKAKIRFMRTKAKRERRVQIALKRRADAKTITKRARRMAIKMLKQRLMKKSPSQMSVAEKERAERMIQQRRKVIDRIALRLVPKIRKMESDRMAGKKAATPGVSV